MDDLIHTFCAVDPMLVTLGRGKLIREGTLAKGNDRCDYWIIGDQATIQNP